MTMMPSFGLKPSSSTSSCFKIEIIILFHFFGQAHVLLVLGVALGADRVDLVDEDDAGPLLLRRRKQVAHAPRAHPHEHLLELGAAAFWRSNFVHFF